MSDFARLCCCGILSMAVAIHARSKSARLYPRLLLLSAVRWRGQTVFVLMPNAETIFTSAGRRSGFGA